MLQKRPGLLVLRLTKTGRTRVIQRNTCTNFVTVRLRDRQLLLGAGQRVRILILLKINIAEGSGANRSLTIIPSSAPVPAPIDVTITVSVSDGAATGSTNFTVRVRPPGTGPWTMYLPTTSKGL